MPTYGKTPFLRNTVVKVTTIQRKIEASWCYVSTHTRARDQAHNTLILSTQAYHLTLST